MSQDLIVNLTGFTGNVRYEACLQLGVHCFANKIYALAVKCGVAYILISVDVHIPCLIDQCV